MRFVEFKDAGGVFQLPSHITTPEDILNLQKVLSAFDYNLDPDSLTGTIDDLTSQAIRLAHQDLGLPPSDVPDPQFISRINLSLTSVPEINGIMQQMATPSLNQLANPKTTNEPSNELERNLPSAQPTDDTRRVPSNKKISKIKSSSPLATDPKFLAKVNEVAGTLGIDPNILMKIMQHESALDPHRSNGKGYVGLIQFGKEAAQTVGVSREKIKQMDAISQMDLVLKYYQAIGVKPGMNEGEVYMLTFVPWSMKGNNKNKNMVLGTAARTNNDELGNTGVSKHSLWTSNPVFARYAKSKGQNYYTKNDVIDYFKNYNA